MSNNEVKRWITEKLFFSGDQYFQSLILEIQRAQEEILLESYILDYDPIGQKILLELTKAQARGIRVKILIDGVGSFTWLSKISPYCEKNKIPLRVYHPLPFSYSSTLKIKWRYLRQWLFIFRSMNKRNHRKSIIIDRKLAFLGSFNISQVHSEELMGSRTWRDTGVLVTGPDIHNLIQAFLQVWGKSRKGILNRTSFLLRRRKFIPNGLIRLNSGMRLRFHLQRDLKRRLHQAKTRVLITNAYFLPRKSVLSSIRKAAKRGVYVALCIPAKSDVWFVKLATKSLYQRLIKSGVHIFEYQPRVLHAKTLIIDDWATVGSHNLNHRSLNHDLEAEAVITHKNNIEKLLHQWNIDITHSRSISMSSLGKISLFESLVAKVIYWFRYWI